MNIHKLHDQNYIARATKCNMNLPCYKVFWLDTEIHVDTYYQSTLNSDFVLPWWRLFLFAWCVENGSCIWTELSLRFFSTKLPNDYHSKKSPTNVRVPTKTSYFLLGNLDFIYFIICQVLLCWIALISKGGAKYSFWNMY